MNRRERLMLMIGIVLLGGIVFKFLIHDPQEAQYETLVSDRDAAATELAKDEQIIARADQARQEYERVRAHIAAVEQKLPDRKEIPALLTTMEQFTEKVGVTFQSIKPGPLTPVAAPGAQPNGAAGQAQAGKTPQGQARGHVLAYSSMPVDISLTGTFAQAVEYLRELKTLPRLVIVNAVALSPQGPPKLGVTIRAEIYTLGTPAGQTGGTH